MLCLANILTYWKSPMRLCDITRYCDVLLGAPFVLSPLTLAFILTACFTLDHYLSISPAFNPWKEPTPISRNHNDNHARIQPATDAELRPVWNDHGTAERNAWGVLRVFTIISYALTASWAASSLATITGAGLVLKFDSPFDPNGGKTEYQDRVIVGFAAGGACALLTFSTGWAAIAISRATNTLVIAGGEGIQGTVVDGPRDAPRVWNHRSTLDKVVLCLLVSLSLSFICGTFSLVYDPFSHLRHMKSPPYFFICFITSFFAWLVTLVSHRHRSYGVSPGTVVRAFMSLVSLVMATVWLLASGTYLFLCVGTLFCDERAPLPYNSPCAYIRKSGIWTGFVACALGYFQAYILGCIALLSWQSRGGIRLAEEEDGGNVVVEQGDSL
ncbi:hypothetical protein FA13DRAFT_1742757 [Coprinellus micaceus]|uniref:Uncharacterized protein n=1 Tax=Coprinellus micaceus TaxID=71717 RepID=A0A4Y7SFN1_COPMI|nr:hypothetical protein FA13DRAFT_1742757 [Coprinellus micaceus]